MRRLFLSRYTLGVRVCGCRCWCFFFFFKQKTAYEIGLGIPAEPLFRSMVANKYAFLQITRRRFLNEWEAFKKVISRRNIRRRITIPLTLTFKKVISRRNIRRRITIPLTLKIGRASCRERVEMSVAIVTY